MHRSTRNRMLIAVMLILLLGGVVIVWDALRNGTSRPEQQTTAGLRFDPATISQVIDDPQFKALAPLAPAVLPKGLGNPAPFAVLEEQRP
ncbi:MAG: hypothetical protein Q7R81_04095 [Candidatus Peregrinibacteria bacterium]|nr:hypothetical protein [Candidatus Peregrinibacteria bacterium]